MYVLPKAVLSYLRSKHLDKWLLGYGCHLLRNLHKSIIPVPKPRHLLFAICDHFEPMYSGDVTESVIRNRVAVWEELYPLLARGYMDADGYYPRHTFFFPGEDPHHDSLASLARLARKNWGEVELHLHHEGDTVESLREKLHHSLAKFAEHGHISIDASGRYRYAFVHGNWCLANAREDGNFCGVDAELPLLFETGCYADYTFPAAPDESQPNIVNQIYWPVGDLSRKRAYEWGERAKVGEMRRDRLLIIQGPLALSWRKHRIPLSIEGSHLTDTDPPTPKRIRSWIEQNIHISGRPEWVFVKVHTHGAQEEIASSLLGTGGRNLHRELTNRYNDGENWVLHYVTAREMYNIAVAAMEGQSGDPSLYRDYVIPPPPIVG
jgi:hypothetical protein